MRTVLPILMILGCPRSSPPQAPSAAISASRGGPPSAAFTPQPELVPAALADHAVAVFNDRAFQHTGWDSPMALSTSGHLLAVARSTDVWLYDGATGVVRAVLRGHLAGIVALGFRSDAQLVTADAYGDLREWDLTTSSVRSLPVHHATTITSLAVFDDWTVSGDVSGNVFVWRDGQVVATLGQEEETGDGVTVSDEAQPMWIGPHGVFVSLGWRGLAHYGLDGQFVGRLDTCQVDDMAFDDAGFSLLCRVWQKEYSSSPDIEVRVARFGADRTPLGDTTVVVGDPMAWDLSDDGRSLAVWDDEMGLRVWDLDPVEERFGVVVWPLREAVDQLRFSGDGGHVVVAGRRLNVVDAHTGETAADTRRSSPGAMRVALLGADGLAVMSDGSRTWLWKPLGDGSVQSLGLGPEHVDRVGDTLFGLDDTVWALQLPSRELSWELAGQLGYTMANASAASADGSVVVHGGYDGVLHVVDGATGERLRTVEVGSEIYDVALSEDGRRAMTSTHSGITLWDTTSGDSPSAWEVDADAVLGWVGDTLAFTGDGQVWTLDTRTGDATAHASSAWMSASYSADGRWLAWADDDARTWLLDLPSGQRYAVPMSMANATALDPRGEHLLVASQDASVAVFRIADLEVAPTTGGQVVTPEPVAGKGDLPPHVLSRATPPVVPEEPRDASANGQVVATLDGEVVVTVAGSETLRFRAHTGYTDCVAVSPDGSVLATGGTDDLVRLWALPDGTSLGAVRAGGPVQVIQFADDERLVFVSRSEGSNPVMGAARSDGTPLWLRDELPYRHSDSFVIRGERLATFHMDKVEFLDLQSGEVVARMPSYDAWVIHSTWTDDGLVTWDRDNAYRWDVSWLP